MEFIDVITNRRSIRRFKTKPVESQLIRILLNCAMYAPSAVNRQPWHFIVIDDRSIMEKIMEVHPNSKMLQTASHAIVVCGDEQLQHGPGYWIADCAAATQNILLAAFSLGLGSCWIGSYPRENRMTTFRELFRLPEHVQVFSIVAVGYPDEIKEKPERFRKERIFRNRWSNPY
jgi:nitroreductase